MNGGSETLAKAELFVKHCLDGTVKNQSFKLNIPDWCNNRIALVMGAVFTEHEIQSNSIIHSYHNHGISGRKLRNNSIPLCWEDLALIPYILFCPDRIEKGSKSADGRDSVRFIKNFNGGELVLVEKEHYFFSNRLGTITLWAECSGKSRLLGIPDEVREQIKKQALDKAKADNKISGVTDARK